MTDFIVENNKILAAGAAPLVAILMGTMNGARFLPEQLDSLEAQTHQNWLLIASDDGSTDDTLRILKAYQAKWPTEKLIIKEGPKRGFCANFLSMACDSNIKADYYAFCDQDDVWLLNKLKIAIQNIQENQEKDMPYVYCGRTIYVNKIRKIIGHSPLFVFPRTFRNALVQSIAGGNTMMFNCATKTLLEKVSVVEHTSHDWFLYQVVTGVGGKVFYDPVPQLLYRQHKEALSGENQSFSAKIERLRMVLSGDFSRFITKNIYALNQCKFLFNVSNVESQELFEKMRASKLKDRLRLLEVAGLYRQTWRGTLILIIAAIFKKI